MKNGFYQQKMVPAREMVPTKIENANSTRFQLPKIAVSL